MATDIRLPATLQAPRLARRALESTLGAALSAEALDVVKLLTSELVTNCVKYADLAANSWIGLSMGAMHDTIRIAVCDPGPGFDVSVAPMVRPWPLQQRGRGLALVAQLSARWGTARGAWFEVWFEVPYGQPSS
ncbi:MAG: ATP-binding protein [Egibacteraceae bacterium]